MYRSVALVDNLSGYAIYTVYRSVAMMDNISGYLDLDICDIHCILYVRTLQSVTFVKILIQMNVRTYLYQQN